VCGIDCCVRVIMINANENNWMMKDIVKTIAKERDWEGFIPEAAD
jgi:hypothetical protein